MNPITEQIIDEIERAVADGTRIAPVTFTACYPRANASAAFRIARKRGSIAVDYMSCGGTPVYRKALRVVSNEFGAATLEPSRAMAQANKGA